MTDISINKFRTAITRGGATPSTPGFAETEGQDPVNPSGANSNHNPVAIGSPANGLSVTIGQVLSLGLASSGVTGALSGTDWDTFNGKVGGSLTSGRIPFASGSNTLTDSDRLVWNGVNALDLGTGLTFRIRSASTATFVSSTTGLFYLRPLGDTDATNQILLTSSGIAINATSATAMLDVNGTARIRTISNLGSTATRFLVASATGVVSERTASEMVSDLGLGATGWTAVGSDIFRNSSVAIGRTTIPTNATFAVQSRTATTTHKFFQLLNNTGTELFSILQRGDLTAIGLTHVFQSNLAGATISRFNNSAGTAILTIESGSVNTSVNFLATGDQSAFRASSVGDVVPLRIRNSAGTDVFFLRTTALQFTDSYNLIFGTTTGTKIGTATSQKLAFWNATPIVQPTTAVASATLVTTLGVPLTSTDTFDGYTLAQIVKALRNTGLLA
jgi:hypothetical protein